MTATAGVFALQNVSAPSSAELSGNTFATPLTSTSSVTTIATYEGCAYMWAYHDDADLSAKLHKAVQVLDPSADANVQLFGEDCVYADGHSTFGIMETDFYVRLPVEDLANEEAFGNWIKQVMAIVITFAEDEVQGKKGFSEFTFIKNETERIVIRVEVSDYSNGTSGMASEELFRKFYTPVPTSDIPLQNTPTP